MKSPYTKILIICCAVLAILGPAFSLSQAMDTQTHIVTVDGNNTFIYNDRGICIINGRMSQDHSYEIDIIYDNATIVANIVSSPYEKKVYIYGYRRDTGNALIFTHNDAHEIKDMLSNIAKQPFGTKAIEKLVSRTLNLIHSWPIDTEVFMSMDKSSIVTMMGEHAGTVRLWSEIMPQSQGLLSAAFDNGITSICGEINQNKSAVYLTGLICLDDASKSFQVGPYPFNSGGCFGRCGADCIGDGPPDNGLNIYTQDCFNHDACVQEQGSFHPCCDEMFALVVDDYLYGSSCTPVLKVTIEPNEARESGAWQIKDEPFDIDSGWHASGSTIDWLPSGVYVLNFSNIDGWETPSPKEITITQESTASIEGIYVKSLSPGKATLVSPSGTIDTAVPAYTWNADAHSTWYYLWVNDSTGNRIKQWYTSSDAGCAGGTGICSITPNTAIAAGAANWWVQTWNSSGYGPWSDAMGFTVPEGLPGKAALVSPLGALNANTPTYTWNAVSNATWYYLWVNDNTGTRIQQWCKAADAGCSSGAGTCSLTPEPAIAAGAARWWIQTWNSAGYGPWSDSMAFTAAAPVFPGKATLVSPSGTISTTTPIYTWNAVADSSWYYLWVNDSNGNRIQKWYKAADAGCSSGAGTCSVTPDIALARGSGKWWVDTWNTNGSGPWSNEMTLTVTLAELNQ
jgi:hypothetical protein